MISAKSDTGWDWGNGHSLALLLLLDIGEAINGKEAVEKVLRLLPNVVLMDIAMPLISGLEATKSESSTPPSHPLWKNLAMTQKRHPQALCMTLVSRLMRPTSLYLKICLRY